MVLGSCLAASAQLVLVGREMPCLICGVVTALGNVGKFCFILSQDFCVFAKSAEVDAATVRSTSAVIIPA